MRGRFARQTPDEARAAAGSALAGVREHIDVTIPGTETTGKMRVLTRNESLTVKAEALAAFKDRGLVTDDGMIAGVAHDDWKCEIAARHLAIAVRVADDLDAAVAPLEDWRELSDEQLSGPWDCYQDLRDRLDPLGVDAKPLTADELAVMRAAAKKKDSVALRSFGLHRLASFAITTAEPPAS